MWQHQALQLHAVVRKKEAKKKKKKTSVIPVIKDIAKESYQGRLCNYHRWQVVLGSVQKHAHFEILEMKEKKGYLSGFSHFLTPLFCGMANQNDFKVKYMTNWKSIIRRFLDFTNK